MSGCDHRDGMDQFQWLPKYLKNTLVYLVLHNVGDIDRKAIHNIIKLKRLRHLDISKLPDKIDSNKYNNPNSVLKMIAEGLPELSSLDISATNLPGNGVFEYNRNMNGEVQYRAHRGGDAGSGNDSMSSSDHEQEENNEMDADTHESIKNKKEMPKCDIVGLISRVDKPLDFLGLYKCIYEPSYRAHIPAKEVSGDLNEAQMLIAGQRYLNRPMILETVLHDLYNNFKNSACENFQTSLDITLLSMDRHPGERKIQQAGSACLYYLVRDEPKDRVSVKVKQKILATLLNAMFGHKDDVDMMRNGCLTLCQFDIPNDVIFDYERLIEILLYIVSTHNKAADGNGFVQRAGICLLNSLACQVEGRRKLLVGDLGAMEKMLGIIQDRLRSSMLLRYLPKCIIRKFEIVGQP